MKIVRQVSVKMEFQPNPFDSEFFVVFQYVTVLVKY